MAQLNAAKDGQNLNFARLTLVFVLNKRPPFACLFTKMSPSEELGTLVKCRANSVAKTRLVTSLFIGNYSQSSSLQSFLSSCLLPDCSCCSNSSLDLTGGKRGRDSGGFYAHINIGREDKEIDLSILQKCSPLTGEGLTSTPESVSTPASRPSVDEARLQK